MSSKNIYLRIDDIGASTKEFEVYSKKIFGNILFLKYLKWFRAWGQYPEMSFDMWNKVFELLNKYEAKLTVGITAHWVEKDNRLIPFYEKFPLQAQLLKTAYKDELIEIANHGSTHCVVGKHLPRLFSSNRKFHREFWSWIPREIHYEHLEKSQKVFYDWLGESPSTLIPPGNVYSIDTLEIAEKFGIKRINSYMNFNIKSNIKIIDDKSIDAFHDREIVLEGMDYLEVKLKNYKGNHNFCRIMDYK